MTTPSTMAKASRSPLTTGVEVLGEITPAFSEILTPEALAFVAKLQRHFGTRRKQCLEHRQERQRRLDQGEGLDFLPETKHIRDGDWKCVPIPSDIQDRRVEITGPTDRAWKRSLFLPAQDGEPPRGAHLERRLPVGAGRAGHSIRDYSRHCLDRDNSGRL